MKFVRKKEYIKIVPTDFLITPALKIAKQEAMETAIFRPKVKIGVLSKPIVNGATTMAIG